MRMRKKREEGEFYHDTDDEGFLLPKETNKLTDKQFGPFFSSSSTERETKQDRPLGAWADIKSITTTCHLVIRIHICHGDHQNICPSVVHTCHSIINT